MIPKGDYFIDQGGKTTICFKSTKIFLVNEEKNCPH
jgi:hypothetical protein